MAVDSVRYLTDEESLRALVERMPEAEREAYQGFKHRALDVVFPGRVMAIYTFRSGLPEGIELLKFSELAFTPGSPPHTRSYYRDEELIIGPTPTRVGTRDVFLSLPQNFVFKWCGQETASGLQFRPQFAILVKTRSKESFENDGHTHCVTLKRFLERFPDKRDEVRF